MDVDDSLNLNFSAEADVGDLADSDETLPISFNWTVDQEILLFEAMMGHKPVGVDKNFHMICIHRKLNSKIRSITAEHIWAKLRCMYDLEALDDSECLPFPEKHEDFALPADDFGLLMSGYPTTSNDTSRSSTVDREVDEDMKNSDSAVVKEESPIEETPPSDPVSADASATSIASSSSSTAPSGVAASAASTTVAATITTTTVATPLPATPVVPTLVVVDTTSATTTNTTSVMVTPSGPTATSTPTSSKPGRKRSKTVAAAAAAANQSDNEKTPSGPSSAKRSRR